MTSERIQTLRTLAATGKQGAKSAAIVELCDALAVRVKRRERAKIFSLSEVLVEAERMNWPSGLAEACHDFYAKGGWTYGKGSSRPIVSLPAAMRDWRRNEEKFNGVPVKGNNEPPAGWPDFLKEKRYDYKGEFKHAPEYMRLEFATWKKGHCRTA